MTDPRGEMLELFRAEIRAHTPILTAASDGEPDAAREDQFHAAHALRGALQIMGLAVTESLARAAEDCLAIPRDRPRAVLSPPMVAALRSTAALLAEAIELDELELIRWDRERIDDVEELVGELGADLRAPPVALPSTADRQLLDIFRVEAEAHAAGLAEGLLRLEAEPGAVEPADAALRAAHSIKGASRVLGLTPLVQLAHAMEDRLAEARRGSALASPEIERLLRATDLFAELGRTPADAILGWVAEHVAALARATTDLGHVPPRIALTTVEPAAAPVEAPATHERDRVVRVGAAVIDRLMGLAGETMVESQRLEPFTDALRRQAAEQAKLGALIDQLSQAIAGDAAPATVAELVVRTKAREVTARRLLGERISELEGYARRADDLGRRLYGAAIASRMRPLADGIRGLPRAVRDLARALGKQVNLAVSGDRVGVDRDILERLEAPLTHLVRNAIDHGLEAPGERTAAGKPPRGQLRLEAYHRAGYLVVVLSDDGRGIDVEQVRAAAIARGLTSAEGAAQLSTGDVLEHLFLPGFSTARAVTEISGRGVGLDVVHQVVHELGGVVRIATRPGQGTSFHLQLPITRSVVRALVVEIAGDAYALPLGRLHRVVDLATSEIRTIEGRPFFSLEGKSVGLVDGHQILELEGAPPPGDRLCVVVVGDRTQPLGIVVDRLLGESDLVVRRLDPRLGQIADVSAASILADGRPALILDVEDLRRSVAAMLQLGGTAGLPVATAATGARARKQVLVVDDSITVRELERQLLANRGFLVTTAVDGLDAWNLVRTTRFDLVITDVDMPRMDGIELVRALKADPGLRSTPVMIVSYRDREEDRLRGLEAGANHYLTKSNFHDDRLLAAAIELIGEPGT